MQQRMSAFMNGPKKRSWLLLGWIALVVAVVAGRKLLRRAARDNETSDYVMVGLAVLLLFVLAVRLIRRYRSRAPFDTGP
jgi:hypothetical protein